MKQFKSIEFQKRKHLEMNPIHNESVVCIEAGYLFQKQNLHSLFI